MEPGVADSTLFDRSRARERSGSAPPELSSSLRALALESAPAPRQRTGAAAATATDAAAALPPPSSLFDELPDAVLRFDRRLHVVYANAAVERAIAVSRLELIGRPLGQVEHFRQYAPLWEAKLSATF
jgi:PAS domain-containing protein